MRHLFRCLNLVVWTLCATQHTALAAAPEYIPVAEWASSKRLQPSWIKRDSVLLLSGSAGRIVLNIDSRQATFNGVRVWLLYGVIKRNGRVHIARTDAQNTLEPLLNPRQLRGARPVLTVCLDPGHGGKDPGYRAGSRHEETYTLLLSRELKSQLLAKKFKVITTRSTDTYVDLDTRPEIAKRRGADIFISLHFNSAHSGVRGIETYCLTPAGAPSTNPRGEIGSTRSFPGNNNDALNIWLAHSIQKSLLGKIRSEDRGVQRARFAVLREATMPAVLVEAGFMSHPVEAKQIYTPEHRKKIAASIVEGIIAYKRAIEK